MLVVSSSGLFLGTVAGFIGSAVLVSLARIPAPEGAAAERGFAARVSRERRSKTSCALPRWPAGRFISTFRRIIRIFR